MSAAAKRTAALRDEGGFTLVELLMTMVLLLLILGPILGTFASFGNNANLNAGQNDAEEGARETVVSLSRQLRNLAGPTPGQPGAIDRATPYDLIFESVDQSGASGGANAAGLQRVRYCLASGTPGSIKVQFQRWTTATSPAVPVSTSCPASGWTETRQTASGISNANATPSRPLFLYDSVDLPTIDSVRVQAFVDLDPTRPPGETELESGVFLRNQNRPPVAGFQASPGASHVLLNASASTDPEGLGLSYTWKIGSTVVGSGALVDLSLASGQVTVTLEVRDPAGLVGTTSQQVRVL
jgi:type II secretory pathway pseudopilin PulG